MLVYGFGVGMLATSCEPQLKILAKTLEAHGGFQRERLLYTVMLGAGLGSALGLWQMLQGLPPFEALGAGYIFAVVLSVLADEATVAIAWDAAGAVAGPLTVPLLASPGLQLSFEYVDEKPWVGLGVLRLSSNARSEAIKAIYRLCV